MIPLRLRAELEAPRTAPFVVRATEGSGPSAQDGCIEAVDGKDVVLNSPFGRLRLSGIGREDIRGDVLFVVPEKGVAHRWIRANSPDNTLLVTEQCDQLCVMCSQPPKPYHEDLFEHFGTAALLAPEGRVIGISGGEPTLYKDQLFGLLLDVLEARPDLQFHVLTNGQHFVPEDRDILAHPAMKRVCWGVPLYSADAQIHDDIVGKAGAFDRLLGGFDVFLRSGAAVELRTVLMQVNAGGLANLAQFVSTHLGFAGVWALMQLENIGFGRKNWRDLFFDHAKDFGLITQAIDTATARGVGVNLYNFPLCTVPDPYRPYACSSISDWKRRYLDICAPCTERQRCTGFFEWHPAHAVFTGVHPL